MARDARPEPCPCLGEPLVADGDPASTVTAPKAKKAIKRRKGLEGGTGDHCVFSRKSGKIVRCYKLKDSAARVAKGFGPKFRLGLRSSTKQGGA